jgi:hypothetical protein
MRRDAPQTYRAVCGPPAAAPRLPPQDSRPSGSILLSCKAISSSIAYRFIPALYLTPFHCLDCDKIKKCGCA